jgi:cell division protein FtsA
MASGDSQKRNGKARGPMIAALDVGSTKIVCFIARVGAEGRLDVLGVGHQPSRGVRAGSIVDLEAARTVIVNTVHAAERLAGGQIDRVLVGLGAGRPRTDRLSVTVPIGGRAIAAPDLRRVADKALGERQSAGRALIHTLPVGFAVDGVDGVRDPRGMHGGELGLDLNLVSAEAGPVRTLTTGIVAGHLEIAEFVVNPFAAGLAVLVEDERELGTIVIDMGGGTTSVAVFIGGALVFADAVPIGGQHVTNDIAHGLSTPIAHAEDMKKRHGRAVPHPDDDREIVDVPQIGQPDVAEQNHMPKSLLTGVIKPRIEETFELVRGKLEAGGAARGAARVVLTGGASQLAGIDQIAQSILDRKVRRGVPRRHPGLAEAATGPAFAVASGLLLYATRTDDPGFLPDVDMFRPGARAKKPRRATAAAGDPRPGFVRSLRTWFHDHF